MKFFEYTLSNDDILIIIDALLQMRNALYFEEIELIGEGNPTHAVKRKIEKCTSIINYFDSKL